jgi:hypothetical protein
MKNRRPGNRRRFFYCDKPALCNLRKIDAGTRGHDAFHSITYFQVKEGCNRAQFIDRKEPLLFFRLTMAWTAQAMSGVSTAGRKISTSSSSIRA